MNTRTNTRESDYKLGSDGRFAIKNYNEKKPFSNFLPGIAGVYGTPMWVFYVNRGQGIASFGTRNKDNAMLEFFPANKAYQNVTWLGFRTFIKVLHKDKSSFYEPFRETSHSGSHGAVQTMEITSNEIVVREIDRARGLEITVTAFTVPDEPLAVLAREVKITNISHAAMDLEVLDGLPSVNPYGMNEFFIKHMSRTIEAWMVAENLSKKAPFLRLKVDATDRPEVEYIEEGNFFFSISGDKGAKGKFLDCLIDPSKVFGPVLDFNYPKVFCATPTFRVPHDQITQNKTPCAFSFTGMKLAAGQSKTFHSYFGHSKNVELLNRYAARAKKPGYFDEKREENRKIIDELKSRVFTVSSSPTYDLYCGQTYLDNVMRGGFPTQLGDKNSSSTFYTYSRKHGDLERDYNRFLVEPTYFSQGDGNYRDVNQNRRSDVWFDPRVKDVNVRTFLNLIQLDGFNPLVLKGVQFHLKKSKESRRALGSFFKGKFLAEMETYFTKPFAPGDLYRFLEDRKAASPKTFAQLMARLTPFLEREERAEHGEGFWTDHWTYNLDLIEGYLSIYPENWRELLFRKKEFTFYDNAHRVMPRSEKYFLKKEGVVRQYKAVTLVKDKAHLIASRSRDAHVVRTRLGHGDIYKTTLFIKLLCLFTNKFASLDPRGVGIEMEAEKPSWYDALNGMPALFGSSLPETFELKRLSLFMIQSLQELGVDPNGEEMLPQELHEFIQKLQVTLARYFSPAPGRKPLKPGDPKEGFFFWDAATTAKEKYRDDVFMGLSGKEKRMKYSDIKSFLEHAREKIEIGIALSYEETSRLYPTYFQNEAVRYDLLKKKESLNGSGPVAHPATLVKVTEFRSKALPYFLEGPVHAMKVEKDPNRRRELLRAVRQSELFDKKLEMYKVNAPYADTSLEVGRGSVFAPGWLENESIWLHMEYKFLLELLKNGLTEEFFKDFKTALVPFQSPERYGRSPLENSSFIVSSAFADASLHGAGFVARLSGSTAEFLQMWLLMNVGKRPFSLGPDGKVSLRFEPHLPAFLFTKEETVRTYFSQTGEEIKAKIPKSAYAFLFLGKTLVVYHNTKKLDTFGRFRAVVRRVILQTHRGDKIEFKGDSVPSPYSLRVRDEFVPRIDIELG